MTFAARPASPRARERRRAAHPAPPFAQPVQQTRYLPSHLLTFAWFAAIHAFAALSGLTCFPAIAPATEFWSAFVQLNRFSTATAGDPLFANLALKNLSSV